MAECGTQNAWYSPQHKMIVLCYEFAAAFNEAYPRATPQKRMEYAQDAIEFTMLHEFGHAAMDAFQLPIAGRAEDAADEFAAYMLFNQMPSGAERLLIAAISYRTLPQGLTVAQLADEHALSGQRYFNLVCYVVGGFRSSPAAEVIRTTGLTPERAARCPGEYAQHQRTWEELLRRARRAPNGATDGTRPY
jgi:hypothetical protein